MFHFQVLKNADELAGIDPKDFCKEISVPETYTTEFTKMIAPGSPDEGTGVCLSAEAESLLEQTQYEYVLMASSAGSLPMKKRQDEDDSRAADFQLWATPNSPVRMSLVVFGHSPNIQSVLPPHGPASR
jgi:hypothetical protein